MKLHRLHATLLTLAFVAASSLAPPLGMRMDVALAGHADISMPDCEERDGSPTCDAPCCLPPVR
jgi:hypothetical protein